MKTIPELRLQIESYHELLAEVRKPYRSNQDEVTEKLVSRLLYETSNTLKALEQGAVKIHRTVDMGSDSLPLPSVKGAARSFPGILTRLRDKRSRRKPAA